MPKRPKALVMPWAKKRPKEFRPGFSSGSDDFTLLTIHYVRNVNGTIRLLKARTLTTLHPLDLEVNPLILTIYKLYAKRVTIKNRDVKHINNIKLWQFDIHNNLQM